MPDGTPGDAASRAQLRKDAAATCTNLQFKKLTVVKSDRGATDSEWWVTYRAAYVEPDPDAPPFKQKRWREKEATKSLSEKARFLMDAETGAWRYFGGTLLGPKDLGEYASPAPPPAKQ